MKYTLKPLDQQVMVITGPSSGIGLATALMAAARGAKLVLASRSENVLDELCNQINQAGGEAIRVIADVGRRVDMDHVADAAVARFGRIDTWVNNAAVDTCGAASKDITDGEFDRVMAP